MRERLGATSLAYLSLDGLQESTGHGRERFCRACLTGEYPTEIPDEMRNAKLRVRGAGSGRDRRCSMSDDAPLTYLGAGVSIEAGDEVVRRIAAAVESTRTRRTC